MKKNRLDIFIKKSNIKHSNKYDYSKVNYINSTEKVCIICPIHGEFWQTPQAHVRGDGCPKCAIESKKKKLSSNYNEFINKAKKIHNNEYSYDKVTYINSSTKVCITCKKHGDFWMTPSAHLNGQKCPKCQGKGLNTSEIIELCKEVHGEKYDYSKVIFTKMHDKVPIICPKHGIFMQSMSKHISKKQGCPICAIEERSEKKRSNSDELIKKANIIHNNKYDYSKVSFNNINDKVEIICKKHGSFFQRFYDHIHGVGCPACIHIKSNGEIEIFDFIKNYFPDAISGDKTILKGKELDIFIPSKNIAIEYNGLRWHSEFYGKDKNYHLNKLNECLKLGISLIQIFEDEYVNNKELVLSKLKHILHIDNNIQKIMGRKCEIKEISYNVANEFLNKYHIQGGTPSTTYLGAFYDNNLIGVMSFIIRNKNSNTWELNRFASNYNYICQGVGGKLFKYFIKNYNPKNIISFADRRWTIDSENNLYEKLGFKLVNVTKPDYHYILINNPKQRIHKFNFRKKILAKKYNLPLSMTENKMAKYLGYSKIWDCGLLKYVYKTK